MEFKLTKFKRDAWSGHTRYAGSIIFLGVEIGRDGLPVTGLSEKDARRLEKKLFKKEGEFAPNSPFWDTYLIPFPEGGAKFNDEDPNGELALAVLKGMKKVAFGNAELKLKSKAEYMLTSTTILETEQDDKLSLTERAYELLLGATPAKLRQAYTVLQAVKSKNSKIVEISTMTDLAVKNGLRVAIAANPATFNTIMEDPKLNIKSEILELVTHRVLSTSNGGYAFGPDQIAYDLDSMVEYMENPHNQGNVIKFKQILSKSK